VNTTVEKMDRLEVLVEIERSATQTAELAHDEAENIAAEILSDKRTTGGVQSDSSKV
jgi:hypothetical protein